ncbi:MAG TPA: putative metal-dependent hydrolase [Bacteroidia bacterium]|jgi:hypothetical protein|nr:putative metal-dependent hydrolase [Bacteroidia bacterium]
MQTQPDIEKLKYPTGKFDPPEAFNMEAVKNYIHELEALPALLENTLKAIPAGDLNYSYRPGGWNIKQIVHHIADSHANFHTRLRLTLTEETPTVKPYDENKWALLADGNDTDFEASLNILKGVHKRAVQLLHTLNEKDFAREYYHPENKKNFTLFWLLGLYAWHGRHHAGQIKVASEHKF